MTALRLSPACIAWADSLAAIHGVSRSTVLREAIALGQDGVGPRLEKLRVRADAQERMP